MDKRVATILLSAFVIAAGCAFLVLRVVRNFAGAGPATRTNRVIAAKDDIKVGAILKAHDLTAIEIAGAVPRGSILNASDAIGRGVLADLYKGEPILNMRLASAGSGGGLAATIRPGMRACAIKVDEVVGVAGFVTPGMRVDVLISGNPVHREDAEQGTEVRTLLQNIEVLSAGTDFQKDAEGKPQQVQVVNLLVTPQQAEVLSLASNQAHLQLVLRNPLDTRIVSIPGTAMSNLFSGAAVPVASNGRAARAKKVASPGYYSVEVIDGTRRAQQRMGFSGDESQ
jgi:pilus assembly protein CpaB